MKTFKPKELVNVPQKLEVMAELSTGYFKVACELRDKSCSKEESIVSHRYVFPSVIMYVSSLEAYFNERMSLDSFGINDETLKEKINNIKAGIGEYKKFDSRLKAIFKLYDKNNQGIDTNSTEYQNLIALVEIRNSVAHYNATFIEYVKWPRRLQQALQRSKIEVMNSCWTTNFSTPAIAMWAYETTKSVVQLFCSMFGGVDPFNCPNKHESFRWDT